MPSAAPAASSPSFSRLVVVWLAAGAFGALFAGLFLFPAWHRSELANALQRAEQAPETARAELNAAEDSALNAGADRKALEDALDTYLSR